MFAYCNNNPIRFVDYTGEFVEVFLDDADDALGFLELLGVGACGGGTYHYAVDLSHASRSSVWGNPLLNGEWSSYSYWTPMYGGGSSVGVSAKGDTATIKSSELIFGSSTKSTQKLMNQMNSRGWTDGAIKNTVDNPYTTRISVNKATGNSATVFYTNRGSYVIVDDITKEIVQISDNINPSTWAPDTSIVNPYIPK